MKYIEIKLYKKDDWIAQINHAKLNIYIYYSITNN